MMKECDFRYSATVLHNPKKRLREFGDAVDSYRYSLDDSGTVDQCGLRLRRGINGDWIPPLLPPPQEKPPEMKKKLKFVIKFTGKSKNESKFKRGEAVEVRDGNEGYKGAWFVATIIDTLEKERFVVEYRDLVTNDDGTRLLKEEIDAKFIRPCPPHVPNFDSFKKLQEVDAWYNDAWWEGVVVELVNTKECFVRFMNNEVLEIECSKLRPHQDWINGKWIISSKEPSELVKKFDVIPKADNLAGTKLILKYPIPCENAKQPTAVMTKTLCTRRKFDLHFYKGEKVEIRSDEKGYEGSWYTATIVDFLHNGNYLVEYSTLKTEDLTEQLTEEVNVSDIRPCPPDMDRFCQFLTQQRVDVWYNDGWWEGVVSNVAHGFNGFKYKVYFWTSNEELEFEHCYLRPHQDWIEGRWMLASLV